MEERRGKCELLEGYPSLRDELDRVWLVCNKDRFITFFPNNYVYLDLTVKIEDKPTWAFDFWLAEGPQEGLTPEEWAVPFIKQWYGVLIKS